MTNTASPDPQTLGQVFTDAKEAREAKFAQVRDYLLLEHGLNVTNQTVANYHHDRPGAENPELIAGIAAFYGLTLSDLPEWARVRCERNQRVLALVGGDGAGRLTGGSSNAPSHDGTSDQEVTQPTCIAA